MHHPHMRHAADRRQHAAGQHEQRFFLAIHPPDQMAGAAANRIIVGIDAKRVERRCQRLGKAPGTLQVVVMRRHVAQEQPDILQMLAHMVQREPA
jgi:hypothetical protein